MLKFCVKGDSGANPYYSSSIIINRLNEGAKKSGLYDENGKTVVYSTTCDDFGLSPDAFLCVYETSFALPILQRANGRPIIGCCLDNVFFVTDTGYPKELVSYCQLGVDSETFSPEPRKFDKEKTRFLVFSESNARNGLDIAITAFGKAFEGRSDVELYLKDRGATEGFRQYVKDMAALFKVEITHDIENTQNFEQVKKIYQDADCVISCSRSSTWNMPLLESGAMGLTIIGNNYSGAGEYLRHGFNGIEARYNLEPITQEKMNWLMQIGCRNHMFPLGSYAIEPWWAETDVYSLASCMQYFMSKSNYHKHLLSKNARITAQKLTWERAAASLSMALCDVCKP